jgi:hypothetical protein
MAELRTMNSPAALKLMECSAAPDLFNATLANLKLRTRRRGLAKRNAGHNGNSGSH